MGRASKWLPDVRSTSVKPPAGRRRRMYLEALVSPLLATPVALAVHHLLPRGNISLVYLTVVLAVAVRTSTRPAMLCALVSFLAYNFFFTEPQLTLMMMHREDILTVGFFLLMAAVTGQLAARMRDQVQALKARQLVDQVQFELSERLTAVIDVPGIIDAVSTTLCRMLPASCIVVPVENDRLAVAPDLTRDEHESVQRAFRQREVILDGAQCLLAVPLNADEQRVAVLALRLEPVRRGELRPADPTALATSVSQQAALALGRTRITGDLERERLEKDRELLRSALLSSVSHDLRTPLAAMIGATTTLLDLEESLNPSDKRELLESVLEEARRLDRYIQNLLDMTRLGHGELKLDRDWVTLEEIVNVAAKRIRPLLHGRRLKTAFSPHLPPLHVHAALLEQALFNVLENAVKFSPEDSTVTLEARHQDGEVIVDIRDEGPGIPAAERDAIFDMFHTVQRGDRHVAGTGLGLAICKGLIGAHGGSVEAFDPAQGAGTVVRLRLPVEPEAEASGSPT